MAQPGSSPSVAPEDDPAEEQVSAVLRAVPADGPPLLDAASVLASFPALASLPAGRFRLSVSGPGDAELVLGVVELPGPAT